MLVGPFDGSRPVLHGCRLNGHSDVTEGLAVSLNAREQQALDSIKDRLGRADPSLQKLLATFTRMASGEQMPAHEDIPRRHRRGIRSPRRHRRRSFQRQVRWRSRRGRWNVHIGLVLSLVWLGITALLVTVALTLNRGGGGRACPGSWSVACPSSSSVPGSPAPRKTTATSARHGASHQTGTAG